MEQRYLLTLFQMELLLSFCFIGQKIVPLLDKKFVNSLPIYIYIKSLRLLLSIFIGRHCAHFIDRQTSVSRREISKRGENAGCTSISTKPCEQNFILLP